MVFISQNKNRQGAPSDALPAGMENANRERD
jgi:hypothetical protein